MVVIWDDHEFSDDSWGATATYTGGRDDEYDTDRKRNAERAFYEWVPTEIGLDSDGMLSIDDTALYPMSGVQRHLRFGSVLDLLLTDSRTNRPDHLIPEDGFPGTIGASEQMLRDIMPSNIFDVDQGQARSLRRHGRDGGEVPDLPADAVDHHRAGDDGGKPGP